MSSFDQLHPSVQHHVVNSLGWPALRPLQAAAVQPVMAGDHALLIAPTAGGKTEAAVFPLLSRLATDRWAPLSTLYLCPLRALLNDLLPRLETYASYTGHRVGLWHGDVGASERRRLLVDPPDILLTTPESLEAMLLSTRVDAAGFFSRLRAVVVDEVHAFASDDRGWHLRAVLARLQRLAGSELQRIGLSATVGNPAALLEWLTPGAEHPRRVVNPGMPANSGPGPGPGPAAAFGKAGSETGGGEGSGARQPPAGEVSIDYVASLDNAATVIAGLHRGEKRLVFVDSRARAENLTQLLREKGITTFVTHASLGRDERHQAEQAFAERQNCVIVATSTLELGIDVGDLDRVIQLDSPVTVASLLQRLGRSGRRSDGPARNMLFLVTREESLRVACGLARLWQQGWVEPVEAPVLPIHLVAHQLLALVLQEGAVGRRLWTEQLGHPFPLGDDAAAAAERVGEHLVTAGFLHDDGGMLSMGPEAEATFGRRHFLELTSVFTTPPLFAVLAGRREVGHVHDLSLQAAFQRRSDDEPPVLLLGGRGWRILDIDWRRRRVQVELVDMRGRTLYAGTNQPLSYELAQSVGAVLRGDDPGVPLSRRAEDALATNRERFPAGAGNATYVVVDGDGSARWWTFAGLRANLELAARLGPSAKGVRSIDGLSIGLADGTDADRVVGALDRDTPVDHLLDLADEVTAGVKFADCLPRDLAETIVLARLTDPVAVQLTLAQPIHTVHTVHTVHR